MNLPAIAQVIGLLIWMLTLGAAWIFIAQRRRLPVALLWPGLMATIPLAFLLRGVLGEASLALPVLAAHAAGGTLLLPLSKSRRLLLGLVATAVLINVSGLGLIDIDLYGLGYFPGWTLLFVCAALMYAHVRAPVLAWSWLIGLGLFSIGLHPSPNMWDALIDVPAAVLALWILVSRRQT